MRGVALDRGVVLHLEISHLPKILRGQSRVHRRVETICGQVPAVTARHPRGGPETLLDAAVVAVLHVGADVEIVQVVLQDGRDAGNRIVQLSLDVNEQRVMAWAGVWPGHQEQVRVAVRAGALVRLSVTGPLLLQRPTAETRDGERRAAQVRVVAGGEHDRVQVMLDAVAGANPDRAQRRDRPVDQLAVVALQGRVVIAGHQHPFAARGEVRGELATKPLILDLTA